jgi:rod shape-determining protein MreC
VATTVARRAIDWVLAGLLLLVPAAILHSSFKAPENLSGFDRVVLKISSPLQSAASWVIEGVGGLWNRYVWNVARDRDANELEQKLAERDREIARLRQLVREGEGFRELAGVRERTPADTVGARIVAVAQTPYFRVTRVTLDRGGREVRVGMPVVAADGVVGRIQRVYSSYADVQLAVDPESSIPVMVTSSGAKGVLRGIGADNGYTCRIEYMNRSEDVKVGDLVVTSGLGGVFPGDVPVGTVKKVVRQEFGLYQEVEVTPAVDFGRLSSVVVLLSQPPPPDPDAAQHKAPEKAFGATPR